MTCIAPLPLSHGLQPVQLFRTATPTRSRLQGFRINSPPPNAMMAATRSDSAYPLDTDTTSYPSLPSIFSSISRYSGISPTTSRCSLPT
jgi:hypothetical protein